VIDAPIDKALGRLVDLKEYKRLAATYGPPLVSTDASTSPNLTDITVKPVVDKSIDDN
jgi:hypothetical protein